MTPAIVRGDHDPGKSLAGRIRMELGWETTAAAYRDRVAVDQGGGR